MSATALSSDSLSAAAARPGPDASPPPLPPDSVYTSCYCEENIYLLAQAFTQLSAAYATDGRGSWPWQPYVVFISNGGKTVALWSQKARDGVVVWDYHVVLVLQPRAPRGPRAASESGGAPTPGLQGAAPGREAWVYDFDTTLPVPCPWTEYVAGTFPYALDRALAARVDERFHSLFRVIPADVYLDHFASDRSHMIVHGQARGSEETVAAEDGAGGAGGQGGIRAGEAAEGGEEGPRYSSPPPPYPPLRGAKARAMGIVHNLMEAFVAMDAADSDFDCGFDAAAAAETTLKLKPGPLAEELVARRGGEAGFRGSEAVRHGQVMDAEGFVRWLAGSAKAA